MNKNMQVSALIPTYNRMKDLNSCLDSIIVQTILPKEVLVIDNGTDTNTKNLIEKREREFEEKGIILDYIKNPRENSLTIAKNIGVKQSTGDIISLLDDDLVLDKDYYKEIITVYKETPNALGVTGYNQSGKGKKRKKENMGYI
jgi:glycosyltransferase involved in cell wall biosynthesis